MSSPSAIGKDGLKKRFQKIGSNSFCKIDKIVACDKLIGLVRTTGFTEITTTAISEGIGTAVF